MAESYKPTAAMVAAAKRFLKFPPDCAITATNIKYGGYAHE